ncbi:hypothetical protein PWM15_07980 [Lactobacillus gasseri]|uniref:hypothetical protein n=1 Tax=Lactobacillus gasseri TaxID=1596 RepID=UPI0020C15ABB|nr:hypothetical protein [Lactobacillus gasseri]MBS7524582.1 hypothetical protein [Lactobacillus gasseri]MDE1527820.1 hypothetical protein [Lactobacillus gasseri]
MLGSPGTGPVGISFSGVSGVTIVVLCSTLTVTVGIPVAVAVTLLGISWPATIIQPVGASGVTATF